MNLFYDDNGYLSCINADDGKTIAIFNPDGTLHPDYDSPELQAWVASQNLLLFDESKIIPPSPNPQWLEFRVAMMQNNGYNRIAAMAHVANPLLQQRFETTIALPNPHIPTVNQLWAAMKSIAPPTTSELQEFADLIALYEIPMEV